MGQSFSSGNSIHLQLDQPFYYNGDHVTGKLYVNVVSTVSINKLHFKVHSTTLLRHDRSIGRSMHHPSVLTCL
jgi:hypothetical protein